MLYGKNMLNGAIIFENTYHEDNRGKFCKYYESEVFEKTGEKFNLTESFISISKKNVIRGLHFQINSPQAKMVSVIKGKVWDVIVDLRGGSETYKCWMNCEISEQNNRTLYIPRGFAHGFLALENETIMLYQCDGKFDKETDTGIIYNDSEIGIEWPIKEEDAIISVRDLSLMKFEEYVKNPMKLNEV